MVDDVYKMEEWYHAYTQNPLVTPNLLRAKRRFHFSYVEFSINHLSSTLSFVSVAASARIALLPPSGCAAFLGTLTALPTAVCSTLKLAHCFQPKIKHLNSLALHDRMRV